MVANFDKGTSILFILVVEKKVHENSNIHFIKISVTHVVGLMSGRTKHEIYPILFGYYGG
jgi:hypothetical protein